MSSASAARRIGRTTAEQIVRKAAARATLQAELVEIARRAEAAIERPHPESPGGAVARRVRRGIHGSGRKSPRGRFALSACRQLGGAGTNFAIFSANATKVEVCLFDENGEREADRVEAPEYTDEIWHGSSREFILAQSMATVCMVLTNLMPAIVSIRTSWCWIPTPAAISAI